MTPRGYAFELLAQDPHGAARRGRWHTPRGPVELPAFMPVGTQATVKGLTIEQLQATGAQMILGNTYHLMLRPGAETIAQLGGLHGFMGWPGPILTDSGGFQVFSLAANAKVSEQGVVFRSHIDGRSVQLTPERAIEIQAALRSDVAMVLDHVVGLPADEDRLADAMQRSVRWAERSQAAAQDWQCLFAIVQGGLVPGLRVECARQLRALDFPGYAVGGLSVGETPAQMYDVLDYVVPELPADKPRYLMGVGRPEDLLQAIARGIDLFDCVMPTRNGRNALAFTDAGKLRLRNAQFERDSRPLEVDCPCPACRHPRAYLRHLFQADEMLGPILLSAHNLTYYQRLLARARAAIEGGAFAEFVREQFTGWAAAESQA